MPLMLCNPLWKPIGHGRRSCAGGDLLCEGSLLLLCGAVVHAVVQSPVYQVPNVLFRIGVTT